MPGTLNVVAANVPDLGPDRTGVGEQEGDVVLVDGNRVLGVFRLTRKGVFVDDVSGKVMHRLVSPRHDAASSG